MRRELFEAHSIYIVRFRNENVMKNSKVKDFNIFGISL